MTPTTNPTLPALPCPSCGQSLAAAAGGIRSAASYSDCLRRCTGCGVGFSNARTNPTTIYEDPLNNVPSAVHGDALRTLGAALNEHNRVNKLRKFGYSTSEDAVTWTVFSHLHCAHQGAVSGLYDALFGIKSAQPPTLLLWGAPLPDGQRGRTVLADLVAVSDSLKEARRSRSEPDVVLDFGADGLVFIEVKYRSGNDPLKPKDLTKFDKYLAQTTAFALPAKTKASRQYELARNWRIGTDLAAERPFYLANLAPARTLTSTPGLIEFEASLAISRTRNFVRLPWRSFLADADQAVGGFPQWMQDYVAARELR